MLHGGEQMITVIVVMKIPVMVITVVIVIVIVVKVPEDGASARLLREPVGAGGRGWGRGAQLLLHAGFLLLNTTTTNYYYYYY